MSSDEGLSEGEARALLLDLRDEIGMIGYLMDVTPDDYEEELVKCVREIRRKVIVFERERL